MKSINMKAIFNTVKSGAAKRSPEILIGIGIAGMIGTTISAVRSTPKALQLIEKKKEELNRSKLTPAETVRTTWTCYIQPAVTGVLSIACILGGNSINVKRNAALATAYTLSETAFKEYKEKVVETVGEKQEQVIRDAVAKEQLDKNPVSTKEVIITGKGKTLFYDGLRYFESDIEEVKSVFNKLNRRLMSEMYISLNDLYYELNLRPVDASFGDELGWNLDGGLIDPYFSAQIADDGRPCIVINYRIAPRYGYEKLM